MCSEWFHMFSFLFQWSAAQKTPGSVRRACVVFPWLPWRWWELFTHLHTVNVDPIAWPAGDSQLLGSDPAAHTVLKATQGRGDWRHPSIIHLLSSLSSFYSHFPSLPPFHVFCFSFGFHTNTLSSPYCLSLNLVFTPAVLVLFLISSS